jgi:hypothetical protein
LIAGIKKLNDNKLIKNYSSPLGRLGGAYGSFKNSNGRKCG